MSEKESAKKKEEKVKTVEEEEAVEAVVEAVELPEAVADDEEIGERFESLDKRDERMRALDKWVPRTELGRKVKDKEISSLEEVFQKNYKIMEPQIVDSLLGDVHEKMIGFTKTTRVIAAGRQFSFRAAVIVGDGKSYVGVGTGKDRERWPAIRKAGKNAKLHLIKVRKGCGSWECTCGTSHSVPFKVEGSSSSVRVILYPAPKGTGLVIGDKVKDVLRFVGIRDVWSDTRGSTDTTLDFVQATINALSKTTSMKVSNDIEAKTKGNERGEY
ncbi:MAG: 30S ribosomal protein S5 [Candidatus Diapherotrites archaeon]